MTDDKFQTRESLFAELLLSFIVALTAITVLMMVRAFNEFVTINTYTQLIPLILTAGLTIIRRRFPNLKTCFLLHVLAAVLFYLAVVFIPFTRFGENLSNMFYLGVIVITLTVASYSYRLKPSFHPGNTQTIYFPACILAICAFFYGTMRQTALVGDLLFNGFMIALMFIVMRQVAVFDEKYYHSIRNSSKPASQLKRQNYKTAAALVGIFVISILVLWFIPVSTLTEIVIAGIKAVLGFIVPIIFAILDFIASLFKKGEGQGQPEEELNLEDLGGDNTVLYVIGVIIAIALLIAFIFFVINTIRLLIINAPKYKKEKATDDNGVIIDTIEDIRPEKTAFLRRRPDFGKGYEKRIRKQFYDKTYRAMRKGLPVSSSSTPGQIENILAGAGDSDITELRNEYEKVRYGQK